MCNKLVEMKVEAQELLFGEFAVTIDFEGVAKNYSISSEDAFLAATQIVKENTELAVRNVKTIKENNEEDLLENVSFVFSGYKSS